MTWYVWFMRGASHRVVRRISSDNITRIGGASLRRGRPRSSAWRPGRGGARTSRWAGLSYIEPA